MTIAEPERPEEVPVAENGRYTMRISRRTVDKLGVKLYDKVSAVVAELIANAYDADAETVWVRLPLSSVLTSEALDAELDVEESFIEIEDDGHGMTPAEANDFFLVVGKDRRADPAHGSRSREKGRKVMGRKGIGKLAPFGICRTIEVWSAGGEPDGSGTFEISHFILEYDRILGDTDEDYHPRTGPQDGQRVAARGTKIILRNFLSKRVPDRETLDRQLARRFGLGPADFEIVLEDLRDPEANPAARVEPVSIPLVEETKIDVGERPVTIGGEEYPVMGWMAIASQGYKHEELAGVRIYARGKIVATTRDFGQMTGFTGEFNIRSYLVGEVHADWLDADEGDDLIRTDRQDIIWDSELGNALREWGAALIKEIGERSREPRRKRTAKKFIERARLEERAREVFADEAVVAAAVELGGKIGALAAEDELADDRYIMDLSDVILSVAPHKALLEAFQDFHSEVTGADTRLLRMTDLFTKSRVAEMASYAQIVAERVKVIEHLEEVIDEVAEERVLHDIIAGAPWLIRPDLSVVSVNEGLRTFASRFEAYWKERYGEEIEVAIEHGTKRPDFTAVNAGRKLHIVELKARAHTFSNEDFDRLQNYVAALRDFFERHPNMRAEFPEGWQIELIADDVSISDMTRENAWERFLEQGWVVRSPWNDFLYRSRVANEAWLNVSREARRRRDRLGTDEEDAVPD